jgi:NAD(P)-dependent dehydrogenase (short-subunit alcohol dehydrogenase family)
MRLTGKTVLVTGAGTGMGLEAAKQLTAGRRQVLVAGLGLAESSQ